MSEYARASGWHRCRRRASAFAARAATYDADDSFVLENYAELKSMGAFAASIPSELGGGGASYHEIAEMLRSLARYCGSTALALSMHTHLVATILWRWRRDPRRSRVSCAVSSTRSWY